MRHRSTFDPRITPRAVTHPPVSQALTGALTPSPNPYTPAVPPLAFDTTGELRNLGAVLTALKAVVESLAGQRGDLPNRAVIFKDLVDYGILSAAAVSSDNGSLVSGGGGNQTIILSGDLIGSGTTSIDAQLVANAVGTTEIANSNVTYAKLQNTSAARLLGNPTGSAASPSEISLGAGLSFAGSVLSATGAGSGITQADADLRYVNVTGDTMTGNLTISPASGDAMVALNKPGPGSSNNLLGQRGGSLRWQLNLGDASAESTGNVGSDMVVNRWSDAGGLIGTALTISRATGNATFGGGIKASAEVAAANFVIADQLTTNAGIFGFTNANGPRIVAYGSGTGAPSTIVMDAPTGSTRLTVAPGGITCYTSIFTSVTNTFICGHPSLAWNAVHSYAFTNASDPSLKRDIAQPPPGALAYVQEIAAATYRWKDDTDDAPTHWGFLAPDVQAAMGADFGGVVEDKESGLKGINYHELTAVLWAAVQELSAKVAVLEARPY